MSASDDAPVLPWTGERYVPQVEGNIRLEHVHRYLLARELSRGKRVLDIACGEGYGTAILATVARHVIGVDIAPEIVRHASLKYNQPHVEFRQGSCEAMPLSDHSVDVVVSFETLEHVLAQDTMLREVQRVLTADGLLMISSPDRHEYSEVIGNQNPYHVKELDRDEFERLLRSYFPQVALAGQRIRAGSLVGPVDASATRFLSFPFGDPAPAAVPGAYAPEYLLAVASTTPIDALPIGLLDGGPFAWGDLSAVLVKVQGQCTVEFARRLGEVIQLDDASTDVIRAEFTRVAERVSEQVRELATQHELRGAAEHRLDEVVALSAAVRAEAEGARNRAETAINQLFETNRILGESQARLVAAVGDLAESRAMTVVQEDLRRAAEQRFEQIAETYAGLRADAEHVRAQLTASHADAADVRAQLTVSHADAEDVRAQLTASHADAEDVRAQLTASHADVEDVRAQLTASHADAEDVRAQLTASHADVEDVRAQLTASHADAEDVRAQLTDATNQLTEVQMQATRSEHARLRAQAVVVQFQVALENSLDRLRTAQAHIPELRSGMAALQTQIDVYENSRSWRLTAPLRTMRRMAPEPPLAQAPIPDIDLSPVNMPVIELPPTPDGNRLIEPPTPGGTVRQLKGLPGLPDGFDHTAYLALNPDVAASGVDPADHYLRHGRHEGRVYDYPRIELGGTSHIRADRDSVLVVSHEASRTGAPMVSLNLISNLAGRYNVVALVLDGGPLVESFERAGAVTVVSHLRRHPILADNVVGRLHDQFRFRFAFVNSIESRVVLRSLAVRFVPVVSLVHEFAAYTRPRDAFPEALLWSSEVVFSANITRESVLHLAACSDARSVHTIPQGRCVAGPQVIDEVLENESERLRRWMRPEASGDDLVIVLGAGSVQLRKGVDLFIDVAARVVSAPGAGHCRFIWLGAGYDPDGDVNYSAYLADQIQRAGLEEHLFLAGETRAIETAYREADIFLMSSRLDPMPNVAVDALAHGKPVLCFDKSTGIAEFLKSSGLGDRCVARYLDTADMADKIQALARSKSLRQEVGEKGRGASISYFNMTEYVTRLEALALKAVDRSRREEQDVELILGSGLYRPDFGLPPEMARPSLGSAVRLHVRSWSSGIRRRKPFPGFHPGVYLEQHGVAVEGSDPTADYIRAGMPDGPWNSTVISVDDAGDVQDLPANESVALHLHVFYPDLLPGIMSRLSSNRCRPDLFVSVTSEEAHDLVDRHLARYEGKVAAIEVVPNRGRDIGPFLTQFGRRIRSDYTYVGHIHTKKTEAMKDKVLGDTWFKFLMKNLLGGRSGAMADTILAAMKADRSLGIVFPDDPNAQGWNANRGVAEELASKIGITKLPQHFNFPVGTMFWARTCALSPLIDANLQWDDYPQEPLPYDGTLLHAIERLLPMTLLVGTLRPAVTNVTGVTR